MKFSTLAMLVAAVSAEEPVWSLRSVNDHRTDSQIQKAYGDHSVKQANSRPPYQSALGLQSSSSSSSSSSSEEDVEVRSSSSSSSSSDSDGGQAHALVGGIGDWTAFKPGDHVVVPEGEQPAPGDYVRQIPVRFQTDDDDIFMRSMYMKYAIEEKTPQTSETDLGGLPTGKFWLDKAGARAAAAEVLATHKGLTGEALSTYLNTYFDKAWNHFDVNQIGRFEVSKASQFMRFLASDQYFQFMYPK